MASLLYRLGKTAYRRWPIFLTAWLVIMVGLGTVAATMSKPMSNAFSIPGIASEKAADLQAELFPTSVNAFDQAGATVVVAAPDGHSLNEPTYRAQVDALVADLADGPQMPTDPAALPANPVDMAAGMRAQVVGASVEAGMPDGAGRGQRRRAAATLTGRPGRADQLELRREDLRSTSRPPPRPPWRTRWTRPGRTVCRWRPTAAGCRHNKPVGRPS